MAGYADASCIKGEIDPHQFISTCTLVGRGAKLAM